MLYYDVYDSMVIQLSGIFQSDPPLCYPDAILLVNFLCSTML